MEAGARQRRNKDIFQCLSRFRNQSSESGVYSWVHSFPTSCRNARYQKSGWMVLPYKKQDSERSVPIRVVLLRWTVFSFSHQWSGFYRTYCLISGHRFQGADDDRSESSWLYPTSKGFRKSFTFRMQMGGYTHGKKITTCGIHAFCGSGRINSHLACERDVLLRTLWNI